ncbi:MAG: hypothetical protein CMJ81_16565 [Planctomycetaceae bacterium]|nr:hypothetical protein [Planctomycetaceae bacterium]MBP63704.1 hypothetical protein [Planctomycetaceae bacterium]
MPGTRMQRILITGSGGHLGSCLLQTCQQLGMPTVAWSHRTSEVFCGVTLRPVELLEKDLVAEAFREAEPEIVVHTAAASTIAACHADPTRAKQVNVEVSSHLTELAEAANAKMVILSTDLVFDGERGQYHEQDVVGPLSHYGGTKVMAEQVVKQYPNHVVIRLSLLYALGEGSESTFLDRQIEALRQRQPCNLFVDEWRTPLWTPDAAQAVLDIACSDYQGTIHLGGPERLSRFEWGCRIAATLCFNPEDISPVSRASVPAAEPRPRDVSLDSSLWREHFPGGVWHTCEEALAGINM